jgi:hypothetical protein
MMNFIRTVLLLLFGLLSLGTGICTLKVLPVTFTEPGLLIFVIPSGLFAVACFFLARMNFRSLQKKDDDPES